MQLHHGSSDHSSLFGNDSHSGKHFAFEASSETVLDELLQMEVVGVADPMNEPPSNTQAAAAIDGNDPNSEREGTLGDGLQSTHSFYDMHGDVADVVSLAGSVAGSLLSGSHMGFGMEDEGAGGPPRKVDTTQSSHFGDQWNSSRQGGSVASLTAAEKEGLFIQIEECLVHVHKHVSRDVRMAPHLVLCYFLGLDYNVLHV
jgi:hypothetical protein